MEVVLLAVLKPCILYFIIIILLLRNEKHFHHVVIDCDFHDQLLCSVKPQDSLEFPLPPDGTGVTGVGLWASSLRHTFSSSHCVTATPTLSSHFVFKPLSYNFGVFSYI